MKKCLGLLSLLSYSFLLKQSVALVQPISPSTAATAPLLQVERMTAHEYKRQRQLPGGPLALDRPIIISDALSVSDCEDICDAWIQTVGSETITVQRKRQPPANPNNQSPPPATEKNLYECTVAQSLELMMQSSPHDSIFAFVEGLLDASQRLVGHDDDTTKQQQQQQAQLNSISQRLTSAREALFSDDDPNWFDVFPDTTKPSDCVVLAGEGATSTLHRDPFEWTGTSLCLEGRKLWRFLKPNHDNTNSTNEWDDRLQFYRLASTAWSYEDNDHDNDDEGDDDMVLSAGWQSDLSLYTPTTSDTVLRTARDLAEGPGPDAEAYLEELASTAHLLTCHETIQPPIVMGVDCCSVVQHPGELLLIPPYWYHQTYAPEPSLAVASQRCGSSLDATRVVGHILALQKNEDSTSSLEQNSDAVPPELLLPKPLRGLLDGTIDPRGVDPKEYVDLLFDYLQQSKSLL